jgi:DNA-binding SARP family transcriptional activator
MITQDVRFRLLGPLALLVEGSPVDLGGPRQRSLLAVLLVNAHKLVPIDHIIDTIWDEQPPETARRQVQNMVSALRRLLAGGRQLIVADGPCYRIQPGPGCLDAEVFSAMVSESRRLAGTGDAAAAVLRLRAALDLWRGPALLGLPGRGLAAAATHLAEERLAATELRFDQELALGRSSEIISELTAAVAGNPLRERLVGQLMRALHGSGRQAEALRLYLRVRTELSEELGIDPGNDLRQVHAMVLSGEPVPPAETAPPAPSLPPAQLPADVAGFVGRVEHLAALDDTISAGRRRAVIVGISGPAGVGKSTLAVHWAHRMRDHFPDGQIFLDLNGYGPTAPLALKCALAHLIEGLTGRPVAVPADPQSAAGMYRSLLAGKRVILVLDNVDDLASLLPLLPGAPGCVALVTSRDPLGGLSAAYGARLLALDTLAEDEAGLLLRQRLGPRVDEEAVAADRLIATCAGLPLALAAVGARAAARPRFSLTELADEISAPVSRAAKRTAA